MNPQEEYNKTHYLYTPLFCEENIWQLILSLSTTSNVNQMANHLKIERDKMWVLIITNKKQKIALLNQQAASAEQPVIWDYHVILLAEINHQFFIFDFDTRLSFVTPLQDYLQKTLISLDKLPQEFIPSIRKIPAQSYLERFHSDRTHMLIQIEKSQFPAWPIINSGKEHCISLEDYLNIEQPLNDQSLLTQISSIVTLEQWLTTSCQ
ncbi:MAG: protein N-terminal glutamine amidohydrolase [Gammaproteobacteria bacterium]|nr:protein N-terminal glutamine amidohydrolase [Gammaproteobacteria bacterium]